ncbi:hypothetical protein GQ600_9441 [Phytophthora cactorum]|nr:hypothetical protein GQ600_9441 [Phytophthora cactorum]
MRLSQAGWEDTGVRWLMAVLILCMIQATDEPDESSPPQDVQPYQLNRSGFVQLKTSSRHDLASHVPFCNKMKNVNNESCALKYCTNTGRIGR